MNNQKSDSRIGTRNADGSVAYWPDHTLSGGIYNRLRHAPTLQDIGNNQFVVLDAFNPPNFDLNAALVEVGAEPQLERTVAFFDNNTLTDVFVPVVPLDAPEAVQAAARAAVDVALEQHAIVRDEALVAKSEPAATLDAWVDPIEEVMGLPVHSVRRLRGGVVEEANSESVGNDDSLPQIPSE